MPSRETFAYRRALKLRAAKAMDEETGVIDSVFKRAAGDFQTFCTLMDKAPAPHMLEWHKHLITGEDSKYLVNIAGPNLDILAPRGSAKSTVLNLFTAWGYWHSYHRRTPLTDYLLFLQYCHRYPEKQDY